MTAHFPVKSNQSHVRCLYPVHAQPIVHKKYSNHPHFRAQSTVPTSCLDAFCTHTFLNCAMSSNVAHYTLPLSNHPLLNELCNHSPQMARLTPSSNTGPPTTELASHQTPFSRAASNSHRYFHMPEPFPVVGEGSGIHTPFLWMPPLQVPPNYCKMPHFSTPP